MKRFIITIGVHQDISHLNEKPTELVLFERCLSLSKKQQDCLNDHILGLNDSPYNIFKDKRRYQNPSPWLHKKYNTRWRSELPDTKNPEDTEFRLGLKKDYSDLVTIAYLELKTSEELQNLEKAFALLHLLGDLREITEKSLLPEIEKDMWVNNLEKLFFKVELRKED